MSPSLFQGPESRGVCLEGAEALIIVDRWLDDAAATALLDELFTEAPWVRPTMWIHGEQRVAPRLTAWYGDPAAIYRYSGTTNTPAPWRPSLTALRERLKLDVGVSFNSVLLNLYRDGADHVGWHADDERELGRDPVIASLSLGVSRRFVLRKKADHADKVELQLDHGSLLVMGLGTQRFWQHTVPPMRALTGDAMRINLTWRCVRPKASPP